MCDSFLCVHFGKWSGVLYVGVLSAPLGMNQNSRWQASQKTALDSTTLGRVHCFKHFDSVLIPNSSPQQKRIHTQACMSVCMFSKPLHIPDDSSLSREKPEAQKDSSVRATMALDYLMWNLILKFHPTFEHLAQGAKRVSCLFFTPKASSASLSERICREISIIGGVSLIQTRFLCSGSSGLVCSTALYWRKLEGSPRLFLFLQMPGLRSPRMWTITNLIIPPLKN